MSHFEKGFTFIWKIENFSMLPHKSGESLVSPTFVVESLDNSKWNLWLDLKEDDLDGSENFLWLVLRRSYFDTNQTTSKISFTLALESANNAFEKSISIKNAVISVKKVEDEGFKLQKLKNVYENINLYLPQDILTIGCHIWLSQENDNTPEIAIPTTLSNYFGDRCSARTTINDQRRVLTWPITKVSKLQKSQERKSINLEYNFEDSPALKLSFYVDKTLNDEHALIEILQISNPSEKDFFVKCKITVVNADKKHQTSHEDYHLFSSKLDEIWYFPGFILLDNIDKEYAYVDDTMFLQCEFRISRVDSEQQSELPMYKPNAFRELSSFKTSESTQLSKKIRGLFAREEFCDVELRAGDQTFPCHKLVLCAQSPVFSAMFTNSMKEKETGVVEVTDLDSQTLQNTLKFMYMEVIEDGLSVEEICKLYSAADKYEVLLLQRRCSLLLLSKLSVENVCIILTTADTHQDNFLWTHIYNFLSINSREVFRSLHWKTFVVDNPTLSKETMIKVYAEEP